MPTRVSPPQSSAVVVIADGLVERYVAQGWSVVEDSPAEVYLSQQNKTQLVATAIALGVDADETLTKKDLVDLIEAARSEAK